MESDQQIEFDDEDTRRDDSKRGMRIKVQIEQHPPLDIPVGRGKQTIKWLSFVAVQRAKSIQPTGCLRVRDENLMKAQVHSVWKATVNTNMRLNTDQMMGDGSLRPDLAIKDVLQDGELIHVSLQKHTHPDKAGQLPSSPWKKSASKMESVRFPKGSKEKSINSSMRMNLPNSHPREETSPRRETKDDDEGISAAPRCHWKHKRWLPVHSTQQSEADIQLQHDLVDELWEDIHIVKRCNTSGEKNKLKESLYSNIPYIFNVFRFYSEPLGSDGVATLDQNNVPSMTFADFLTFLQDNDVVNKENSRWFRARVLIARAYSIRFKDVRILQNMRTATDLFDDVRTPAASARSTRTENANSDTSGYPLIPLAFFVDLIAETAAAVNALNQRASTRGSASTSPRDKKEVFVEGYRLSDRPKWPSFAPHVLSDFCGSYLVHRAGKVGNTHGVRSALLDRRVCRRIAENVPYLRHAFIDWCESVESDTGSPGSKTRHYQSSSRVKKKTTPALTSGDIAKQGYNLVGLKMSFQIFERLLESCTLYQSKEDTIVASSAETLSYPPIEMRVQKLEIDNQENDNAEDTMLYDLDDGRNLNYDDVGLSFILAVTKDEALLGFNIAAQDSMLTFVDTDVEFPYSSPSKHKASEDFANVTNNSKDEKKNNIPQKFSWRDVDQSLWRREFHTRAESGEAKICFSDFVEALMRLGLLKFENSRLSVAEKIGRVFDHVSINNGA